LVETLWILIAQRGILAAIAMQRVISTAIAVQKLSFEYESSSFESESGGNSALEVHPFRYECCLLVV